MARTTTDNRLPDMGKLAQAIFEAQDEYEQAHRAYSEANSAECAAINKLSNAQKAFDTALATLKQTAPRSSEWAARRHD